MMPDPIQLLILAPALIAAGLAAGLNVCAGQITHAAVAAALGKDFEPAASFIAAA